MRYSAPPILSDKFSASARDSRRAHITTSRIIWPRLRRRITMPQMGRRSIGRRHRLPCLKAPRSDVKSPPSRTAAADAYDYHGARRFQAPDAHAERHPASRWPAPRRGGRADCQAASYISHFITHDAAEIFAVRAAQQAPRMPRRPRPRAALVSSFSTASNTAGARSAPDAVVEHRFFDITSSFPLDGF